MRILITCIFILTLFIGNPHPSTTPDNPPNRKSQIPYGLSNTCGRAIVAFGHNLAIVC